MSEEASMAHDGSLTCARHCRFLFIFSPAQLSHVILSLAASEKQLIALYSNNR